MIKRVFKVVIIYVIITVVISINSSPVQGAGASFDEAQTIGSGMIKNEKLEIRKANYYKVKTTPGQMIKATLDFVVADYQRGSITDELYYGGRVHIQMYSEKTRTLLVDEEAGWINGKSALGRAFSLHPDWGIPIREVAKYLTSTADESEFIFIKISYSNILSYDLFKSIVYHLNIELTDYYDAGYEIDAPHNFDGALELTEGEYRENYLSYKSWVWEKDKLGSDLEDYFKVKVPARTKLTVKIKPEDNGRNRLYLYSGEDRKELFEESSKNQGQILVVAYENKSKYKEEIFIKVEDQYKDNLGFKYGIEISFDKITTGLIGIVEEDGTGVYDILYRPKTIVGGLTVLGILIFIVFLLVRLWKKKQGESVILLDEEKQE